MGGHKWPPPPTQARTPTELEAEPAREREPDSPPAHAPQSPSPKEQAQASAIASFAVHGKAFEVQLAAFLRANDAPHEPDDAVVGVAAQRRSMLEGLDHAQLTALARLAGLNDADVANPARLLQLLCAQQ